MYILKHHIKRTIFFVLSSVLFLSLCFSCTKEIKEVENIDEENTVTEREQEVIVKDGDLLQLSISSEMNAGTKAHWDDLNGVGTAQFEWDETTDENADMVVCANKDYKFGNGLVFWYVRAGAGEYTTLAKVQPDSSNSKLANITTLWRLYFDSKVGQKIYCVAPINSVNGSSVSKRSTGFETIVDILMPYAFKNTGSQNLKGFKDYSYIYAETTIDKVVKANNTYGILGTCRASFKAIPAVFRLSVTNKMTENVTIDRIVAKAFKDSVEVKIFPNKLIYKVDINGTSIKESADPSASDSYYSTLIADLSSSTDVISTDQNGLYYMFVLPRDEYDSYRGVELEFTVWATIDGVEKNFKITKTLDALKTNSERGINFNSGYIYTFKLDLNSANLFDGVVRYADGEVSVMQRSSQRKYSKIIITGDGYDADDLKRGGTFEKDAKDAFETIFSLEPFASYREYFQVYCLYAESNESGSSGYTTYGNSKIETKDTKYKVQYDEPWSSSMSFNDTIAKEVFKKVPGFSFVETPNTTTVIILVNHGRYAGTCWLWPHSFAVAMCPMNREPNKKNTTFTNYKNIIHHEFNGHAYGLLADEYFYNSMRNVNIATDALSMSDLKNSQSNGASMNVTLESDSTKVPWAQFMDNKPKYDRVGLVEGGYYFGRGVWRCEEFNCMIDNRAYFSAYCRYLQYKRIMETSGYSLLSSIEAFMPIDEGAAVEPDAVDLAATPQNFVERVEEYPPLGKPVYMEYK